MKENSKSTINKKKKNQTINKFKEKYFDYYDDIKHEFKNKDIEW